MKCVVCRSGEVQLGKTTLTFEREGHTVVIREVPAQICNQCGESYTDQTITHKALSLAEEMFVVGVEVGIRNYRAA